MIRIIQLTDLHILGDRKAKFLGLDSRASFEAVLDLAKRDMQQTPADLIMLTGDLAQDESEASYQYIKEQLSFFAGLNIPVTWIPGNHDDSALGEKIIGVRQKQYIFDDWNIILLDSHYAGHESGMVDQDDLEMLDAALAAQPDKYAMVVVHHHLLPSKTKWLDTMMVENRDQVLDVLTKYSNIKLVVFGHIHHELQQQYEGMTFFAAPATSVQFTPDTPTLKLDTLMPGYRWIELNDDGSFTTAVQRIEYDPRFIPDLTITKY